MKFRDIQVGDVLCVKDFAGLRDGKAGLSKDHVRGKSGKKIKVIKLDATDNTFEARYVVDGSNAGWFASGWVDLVERAKPAKVAPAVTFKMGDKVVIGPVLTKSLAAFGGHGNRDFTGSTGKTGKVENEVGNGDRVRVNGYTYHRDEVSLITATDVAKVNLAKAEKELAEAEKEFDAAQDKRNVARTKVRNMQVKLREAGKLVQADIVAGARFKLSDSRNVILLEEADGSFRLGGLRGKDHLMYSDRARTRVEMLSYANSSSMTKV